jgi:phospholipase/lecithinase/hemolysin
MAPRSVLMERRERFQKKFPMEYYWTATLTFTVVLLMLCGAAAGATGGPFKHLFGVGDSFLDTGNRDPTNNTLLPNDILVNQDWKYPYGISLGAPVGRYSDGLLFFDFIAAGLGLNPVPYRKYAANPSQNSPADGVNFATAGAGVFTSLGFTTTEAQITELQGVLATNNFNLSQSIVLYSVNGNDYAAFILEYGEDDYLGLIEFVIQVVGQMVADVVRLFNLGFTNIAVTQLAPLGCEPSSTMSYNYSACVTFGNVLVTFHNSLLVSNLSITLPSANIIFLDFYNSFNSILNAIPGTTGFSSPILKPCCAPTTNTSGCAYVDSNNKPLYTLCNNPAQSFFWDSEHPTEAGWSKIYNLLLTSSTYTGGRRSLQCFLYPQLCQ